MDQKKTIDVEQELGKPRLGALLFADWASANPDGKIVLAGVFDNVVLPVTLEHPHVVFGFYLFVKVGQAHKSNINIWCYSPNGDALSRIIMEPPPKYVPDANGPNLIQAVLHVGLEFNQPGIHWFDVEYDGQSLGKTSLIVSFQKVEQ